VAPGNLSLGHLLLRHLLLRHLLLGHLLVNSLPKTGEGSGGVETDERLYAEFRR